MRKMKSILTLSVLLALSLVLMCSCDGKSGKDGDCVIDTEAAQDGENSMASQNKFTYASENYTFDGTKAEAKAVTDDMFEQKFGAAFSENSLTSENYAVEAEVKLDNALSSGGIIFGAKESEKFDGFEGYALMLRDRRLYLYEITGSAQSGMVMNQLADKVVKPQRAERSGKLRVERDGNTYRMYFLDDMEGVEPWPEFEFVLTGVSGSSVGYIDNGHGASFDGLDVMSYTAPQKDGNTYKNPVFGEFQAADPGVLKYDGKYYCYSTSAPIGYYVYVSDDLVNWENKGLCCDMAWGIDKNGYYWAPEVIEKNGKFYMIMSVDERIGFAVADSPLGPFVPEETWLFEKTIDGHIFVDDDGKAYLFYVSWREGHDYGIYACELEDDIVTAKKETEKLIIRPESAWEKTDGAVTEGPFVLKHNGKYYLTYSGNGYTSKYYAVGYAVSDSPLGDYERYDCNPILSYTSKLYGPGHHSFTTSPDGSELIIVYHVHASTTEVHPRKICIDRARFAPTESGVDRLEIFGPTHTAQEYPK